MRPGVQPPSGSMACPLVPPSGRLTNQPARPLLGESRWVGRKGRLTAGFTRGRRFTCHSEAQAAAVRRPSLHTWPRLGQGHFRKRGGRSFLDIGAVPTLSAAARHPRPRGPLCHLPVRATTSWLSRAHGALPVLPPPSSSSAAPCLLTARRSPVGSVRLAGHPLDPPGLCPAASRVWGAGPAHLSSQQNLSFRSHLDAHPPRNSSSTPSQTFLPGCPGRPVPGAQLSLCSSRPVCCPRPLLASPRGAWGTVGARGHLLDGWMHVLRDYGVQGFTS